MSADSTTLAAARWLRGRGFSVIPLDHPADPIAVNPKLVGKVPIERWEDYQTTPADDATLVRWFGNGRQRNIAIVTGAVSARVVVDIDSPDARTWAQTHLPFTPVKTKTANGEHWFYRHPGTPVRNKARITTASGKIKLDVRGDGGYVVAPGSTHASGVRYEKLGDWTTPLDSLPVFECAWIAPPKPQKTGPVTVPVFDPGSVETRAEAYLSAMGPAIEGQGGDAHTFRAAGVLVHDFALDDGPALALLRAWNTDCRPPWTDAELDAKLRNARRYGSHPTGAKLDESPARVAMHPEASPPREYPLTDSGNAEYFAAVYGDDLRYDHRRARWLVWTGHRWQPDADAAVYRRAKAAMRRRLQDAARLEDSDARTRLAKWALQSESRGRLDALLYLARAEHPIADAGDRWDCEPMLLGVPNGVVDLRRGTLRPGQRDDRITMGTAVPFVPDATCPRWEQFLREVFADDRALVDYVHRATGYSLTGITTEQVAFVESGGGANGKGTLNNTLTAVLGDYAYSMPFSTLEMQQRAAIPNDVAALDGPRYVTASETNDGTRLNEGRLKALTGCDPMTARFLHGEFFTFRPQAKFWLSVNHRPIVRDDSHGFWRRIRLLPFTQTFAVNPRLADDLLAEGPGILALAVRGCLAWQRDGLVPPAAVVEATATYEADSDPISDFLDEATDPDPAAEVRAGELYEHYVRWAEGHGMTAREWLTATMFGRKLQERLRRSKTRAGWVYHGVFRRNL